MADRERYPVLSVEEAQERVLALVRPLEAESVPLLQALDRVLADARAYDADVLALYREGDDTARVSAAVFALAAQGVRVFAATRRPADMRAARTLTFTGEGFEEVLPNA